MRVNIDNSPVSIEGLDIFTEFSAISTDAQWRERTVTGVRADADGEHVWIDPDVIACAAKAAGMDASWSDGFARMRSFAAGRGWIDELGWIRAHVVAER